MQDSYTKKLKDLMELRDQLKLDKLLISEGRYVMEKNRTYQIFRNDRQQSLIRQCEKFPAANMGAPLSRVYSQEEVIQKASGIAGQIDQYLMIIAYEIELIHCNRQILWQNETYTENRKQNPKEREAENIKGTVVLVSAIVFGIVLCIAVYAVYIRLRDRIKVDVWTVRILLMGIAITIFGIVTHCLAKWKDKK